MSDEAHRVRPVDGPLDADVVVPGSKSLTNRALVAALLAEGTSTLTNVLVADDTEGMVEAVRALGAEVTQSADGTTLTVVGTGGRLRPGPLTIHARQAGTTARFLPPVLAMGTGRYTLDADPAMRVRPMAPLIDALRSLGVTVEEEAEPGHLPFTVVGTGGPMSGRVAVRGDVSSQFVSGLLLAGVEADVTTDLVSRPYVEMTRAVVAAFAGGGTAFAVEPDATAASYFLAAAAICGGRVTVPGLGRTSLQGDLAFVDVLGRMGADVEVGEAAVTVRGSGTLHGVEVDMGDISDTAQTLAATAVFGDSPTRVTGIGFIRRKETDRVGNVVRELRRCGIEADEEDDGFVIRPGTPRPAVVETYGDHRMAMSFALLGLRVDGIDIADPGCVAKTFPGFWDALESL